jgi:hypothetical protein
MSKEEWSKKDEIIIGVIFFIVFSPFIAFMLRWAWEILIGTWTR